MLGVAAKNPNTIVVVHSVGPLIVEPWIEHPNVTAVCILIDKRYVELIIVNLLGPLGGPTGPRSRQCHHGRFVWRLESFWKASVYDCETVVGLSCSGRVARLRNCAD